MRTITAPLAAVLGAAVLAGSAAAAPADSHHQPWYAGESTITGSRSDSQAGSTTPKADVYVAPASAYRGTVTPKANVYVPPASEFHGTVTQPTASGTTNPQPAKPHEPVATSSSGFDWGSAGIGAGAGVCALLIALGGVAVLRHRRGLKAAA